jgi:hypothetical protein
VTRDDAPEVRSKLLPEPHRVDYDQFLRGSFDGGNFERNPMLVESVRWL